MSTDAPESTKGFRGPFADGPPPDALVVETPALNRLRPSDFSRFVVVFAVLGWSTLWSLAAWAVRRGGRGRPTRRSLTEAACDGLVDGFIHLGPTFVKGGQIMASSGGGLVPEVLATAARRCLDAVPPFPVAAIHRTIEEDLGHRVDQLFATFDDVPLSAASIGQVHACTTWDGRDAVVKVQRPGIRRHMARDLRNGYRLAWLFERTPWGRTSNACGIIADLHAVTFQELTPAREAWQQHRFRERIGAFGDNAMITAPEVYWEYCGPRVICMERVFGIPMDHFDEMRARGIDGQLILRRGAKVWTEAAIVHGPFHGDMHAGNLWALDDGRGCFLDFGIMGELSDQWKDVLRDLFYTCTVDLDFTRVARAYRRVGAVPPDVGSDEDLGALMNGILGPMVRDGFGRLDIAQLVTQSMVVLKAYNASVPQELMLIGKQLFYIDRYSKHLASDYAITADPLIVKNIFPAEAAARAAELGLSLDDESTRPSEDAAVASS